MAGRTHDHTGVTVLITSAFVIMLDVKRRSPDSTHDVAKTPVEVLIQGLEETRLLIPGTA